jgi:hypothetical protein
MSTNIEKLTESAINSLNQKDLAKGIELLEEVCALLRKESGTEILPYIFLAVAYEAANMAGQSEMIIEEVSHMSGITKEDAVECWAQPYLDPKLFGVAKQNVISLIESYF